MLSSAMNLVIFNEWSVYNYIQHSENILFPHCVSLCLRLNNSGPETLHDRLDANHYPPAILISLNVNNYQPFSYYTHLSRA